MQYQCVESVTIDDGVLPRMMENQGLWTPIWTPIIQAYVSMGKTRKTLSNFPYYQEETSPKQT
jgi:Na+-transporting NADH:ubiquinone oxidoreductase subunit NqrC